MAWNTTNSPTDLERIRRALKVPAEKMYLDIIRISMDRVEKESPDTIETIQEILDSLESNRTTLRSIRNDSNYGMVKADVVEWEAGSKDTGMVLDRAELLQELATALLIQLPDQSYGTLGRS